MLHQSMFMIIHFLLQSSFNDYHLLDEFYQHYNFDKKEELSDTKLFFKFHFLSWFKKIHKKINLSSTSDVYERIIYI
jgi:hypothetical protein